MSAVAGNAHMSAKKTHAIHPLSIRFNRAHLLVQSIPRKGNPLMKTIHLTKGYSAVIDDADYDAVIAVGSWSYEASYAVHYFADEEGRRKRLWLHRLIMLRSLGHPIPTGIQVDHINANRLDNQHSNLRLATRSENQAAKGLQKNSSSGCKGVHYRKGKFEVRLRHYHRRLYLGRFESLELAHAVYAYAHLALWGEFSSEYDPARLSADTKAELFAKLEAWQRHKYDPS